MHCQRTLERRGWLRTLTNRKSKAFRTPYWRVPATGQAMKGARPPSVLLVLHVWRELSLRCRTGTRRESFIQSRRRDHSSQNCVSCLTGRWRLLHDMCFQPQLPKNVSIFWLQHLVTGGRGRGSGRLLVSLGCGRAIQLVREGWRIGFMCDDSSNSSHARGFCNPTGVVCR